jgi:hypothetical protein
MIYWNELVLRTQNKMIETHGEAVLNPRTLGDLTRTALQHSSLEGLNLEVAQVGVGVKEALHERARRGVPQASRERASINVV